MREKNVAVISPLDLPMPSKLRSLYICYYPLTEPLVQTQVVAYLAGLAQCGHHIHLLTFETEPLTAAQKRDWRKRLKEQGVIWHHLRYHKRPSLPATVYDVACGVLAGLKIIRHHHLDAVHARSHVPATMGLMLKKLTGCRLIFDIRGLMAEEYVDAGNWQQGDLPYRLVKSMEKRCIEEADGIVVLTERVKSLLFNENHRQPLQVIPCCANLTQIADQASQRATMRDALGLKDRIVIIYTGKLGGWYMQAEMVDFFSVARKIIANLHFVVLTQSDPQLISHEFARSEVPENSFTISCAKPADIGGYLAAGDMAFSFIKPCFSKIASSPTKFGEYLAAGLPVICSAGIGDIDDIVLQNRVGVCISEFTETSYHTAVTQMLTLVEDEDTTARCRQTAQAYASLQDVGIPRYQALYAAVAQAGSAHYKAG